MSDQAWVLNASPLILLGKLGRLDLAEALAPKIIVPASVAEEITAGMIDSPARETIAWARPYIQPDIAVPESVLNWDIGAGESQVLAYCLATGSRAVLDDGDARAAAKAHRVRVVGSLGIILRARKNGLIPAARPLIEQLVASGSYLAPDLIREAFAKVGEFQ